MSPFPRDCSNPVSVYLQVFGCDYYDTASSAQSKFKLIVFFFSLTVAFWCDGMCLYYFKSQDFFFFF